MATLKSTHWTGRSINDFLFRIGADFIRQIERVMERDRISQVMLASTLGVSKGRVSQIMNNPGNLTLARVIGYAQAVGQKVALVAYDDGDPLNKKGPVSSEIFTACWEMAGKPTDFFELDEKRPVQYVISPYRQSASSYGSTIPFNVGSEMNDASTSSSIQTMSAFQVKVGGNG